MAGVAARLITQPLDAASCSRLLRTNNANENPNEILRLFGANGTSWAVRFAEESPGEPLGGDSAWRGAGTGDNRAKIFYRGLQNF